MCDFISNETGENMKNIHNEFIRMKTNYKIGDLFTVGGIPIIIADIYTDEEGINLYRLNDGRCVTGHYLTFCTD